MILALEKRAEKVWDKKCDEALAQIKQYLSSTPVLSISSPKEEVVLYLAVSQHTVSVALMKEQGKQHLPIYFINKALLDAEIRYLPVKKLSLALVCAARKLRHYFETHTVRVLTEHPLQVILQKSSLSGRLVEWAIKLSEHDIKIALRKAIKGQVVADFIAEFTHEEALEQSKEGQEGNSMEADEQWQLYVDGVSNSRG